MYIAAIPLILFLLNGCAHSKSPGKVPVNQEFDLKIHETASMGDNFVIQFQTLVQESRCPKGYQCISEGSATIQVQLSRSGETISTFELSTDPIHNEASHENYRFKLMAVNPYPIGGQENDPERYIATILITKS